MIELLNVSKGFNLGLSNAFMALREVSLEIRFPRVDRAERAERVRENHAVKFNRLYVQTDFREDPLFGS